MSASRFKRLQLWLRHSAERADGVAHGKTWLLAALLGVVVALGVLAFNVAIEWLTVTAFGEGSDLLAQGARDLSPGRAFLAPVIGGTLVAALLWIAHREGWLPNQRCQGVAEVIEARATPPSGLSLRSGVANTAITALALGSGASTGREGPLVAMGGAMSVWISNRFGVSGKDARTLLGCSAAAAVSAAFDAPIAGVLFALEVILSNYALSVFGPVTLSSIVALLMSRAFAGTDHSFSIPAYEAASGLDIPLGALLGIVCGAVAYTFLQSASYGHALTRKLVEKRTIPAPLLPVIAGLGMGIMAIFLPEVLGLGYQATDEAINGNYSLGLLVVLLVAKMAATVLCLSCRFGTGVFSGGIYLGVITGAAFGLILNMLFPESVASPTYYAMIGMGAVSGAIIGAPISTTLIVFELTGDYSMTAALMLAVGIATVITQIFFGSSWFHHQLNQRGYDLSDGPQGVILQTIRVRDVMRPMQADAAPLEENVPRLVAQQSLGEALARMSDLAQDAMPVVEKPGSDQMIGTLTQIRALRTYNEALVDSHIEHHR